MSEKNKLVQSLQNVWEQTSVPARFAVIAASVLGIALIAAVAWWSMAPHYIPLARDLNPQKAGEIRSILDENGIANKNNFSGSGILVDQNKWDQANQLVSHMVDSEQLESDPMEESLLTDPGTKDHRLTRDLEMRLGKTISQLKSIESARVHLGIPEAQPFVRNRRNKTASVTIKMRPGTPLSRRLSSGVISLVANSVEGLDPANVNLLDTEGNTYLFDESTSGVVSAQLEDRRQIEQEKAEKAESMLAAILGPGRAVVRVTADVDFTRIEKTETTYDPGGQVPLKEIIESTKGTAADPLSIGGIANQGAREIVSSQEKNETEYANPETRQTMIQQPGMIKRLTVAVTVQLVDSPAESDEGAAPVPANQPTVTLEQVEEMVKKAVGFDETRSDQIEVLSVARLVGETSLLDLVETPPVIETWMPLIRSISLGIAALVALVLGLLTLKRIKPIQMPGNDGSGVSPQRARQLSELATLARKNPELMSSILASWINEPNDGQQSGSPATNTQTRNAA